MQAGARPSASLAERGAHTRVGFEGSEGEAVSYERVEGRVVGAELEVQHEGRFWVDGTTALSGRRAPAEFIELPAFDRPVDAQASGRGAHQGQGRRRGAPPILRRLLRRLAARCAHLCCAFPREGGIVSRAKVRAQLGGG